jgi:signal transduction histidine kinase
VKSCQIILNRFFSERSFPISVKTGVFLSSLFLYLFFALIYMNNLISPAEAKLSAYFFYVIIFFTTFVCGFMPGILLTAASSFLVISIFIPSGATFASYSPANLEVFPFLALYFLIVIIVDWFRKNFEDLKTQSELNRELYEQAKNLDKLALAGEIAAGIAHEIRNPLTVVNGYIQLLTLRGEGKREECQEIYSVIQEEIKRTNQILSDFLLLSRPAKPNKTMVQLNKVIETTSSLIYGEALRNKVVVNTSPDPDLPETCLDREQMVQVLLNLCSNAIQAMPDGGSLSVKTSYNRKKERVDVEVSDTGHGISQGLAGKIFMPFFTTRENGTGLGLAITQGIVLAHGGEISVVSEPGCGSSFRFYIPLYNNCNKAGEATSTQ